jgi:hypothetical protein
MAARSAPGQRRWSQHVRNESAYPPIAAREQTSRLVGSVPNSALEALSPQVRLAAASGTLKLSSDFALVPLPDSCVAANVAASFKQRVGAKQKRFWNHEAYGLRSLQVDGQLELRRLLYR